jgi:hypothetical protein
MAIETKHVDISEKEYASQQEWAENTKGVYMNLLGGVRWDPTDNKYKMAPIKYSDVNLEGEKIRFSGGQEYTVVFSCLAKEYAHKTEVREAWWEKARSLVEAFKEERKLDGYLASNNTDLKKLRSEGNLLDKDDLEKE